MNHLILSKSLTEKVTRDSPEQAQYPADRW